MTYSSRFKTYCSLILTSVCIKNRGKIIASHPSDYMDDENVNMRGFPFEENGYTFYSINEDSFGSFLSYKIEKHVSDKTDVSFSFNALFPKFNSIEKIDLKILQGIILVLIHNNRIFSIPCVKVTQRGSDTHQVDFAR